MKKNLFIALLFITLSFSPALALAFVGLCCGKCGGNMPMNIPGGGVPETHEFRIKISPMYMKMGDLSNNNTKVNAADLLGMPMMMGRATGKYMAVPTSMEMWMGNITVGYSFTDDFFAGIMAMPMKKSMKMKLSPMMQMATGTNGFTMESQGFGDTMVMSKYRLYTDDPLFPTKQVSFFAGVSLPTGSITEKNKNHPLASRQNELLPYGMQLGSGTFDPTIGLLFQSSASPYWWGINGMYTTHLYKNNRDYSLGDEFRLDVYGMYQVTYNFLMQLQVNSSFKGKIKGEMKDVVNGTSGRATQGNAATPYMTPLWDKNNYGGDQISITAGFQLQPASLNILDFNFSLPVYHNNRGIQLKESYRAMLTWYIEIPTSKSRRYMQMKSKGSDSKLGF
ncbi:MAG: transporter [Nitrospinae bacterium]|nr:transporter [Nitrospinota bacterium]